MGILFEVLRINILVCLNADVYLECTFRHILNEVNARSSAVQGTGGGNAGGYDGADVKNQLNNLHNDVRLLLKKPDVSITL